MSLRRERRGKAARGSIVAVSQKTCPSSHANGAPDRVRGRSGLFRACGALLLSRSNTPLPGPAGRLPMTIATNLGFSRMGPHRELKKAMERFWAKKSDGAELLATAGERDPK